MPDWKSRRRARTTRPSPRFCRPLVETLEDRMLLANAIVTENQLPGTPESVWGVSGTGDSSLQGFATDISVDQGQTISFKIHDATSAPYRIDIYRLGYYGGNGARLVTTIPSSQTLRQVQPNPLTNAATGLVDAGNWTVSASWAVPTTATSGLYIARPRRDDTGGASHIYFVVRDDDGASDLLFQTADTTWQAYNDWGGNSLYVGPGLPDGRAYKVSYNRPLSIDDQTGGLGDYNSPLHAEYPMIRWLEANGYNVSYTTDVDTDRRGAELLEHDVFLSVGHDEYWSAQQRANVEAARDAGVHLAFFSGNEVFWKTRWENSIDASGTPYRTLVCYKESKNNAKIDPSPVWTGTWRDDRFSPPSDGGRPENALSGTIYMNDRTSSDLGIPLKVPEADGKLRFWRNTSVANLAPGQTATLGQHIVGYETDEDLDNGFRPGGLITMSSTFFTTSSHVTVPWGTEVGPGSSTHKITLHRASSGALVFGAGTVQWSWGLDGNHKNGPSATDPSIRQATVNLFADMGVQPESLQPGLVAATASTDTTRPSSTITSPAAGSVMQVGTPVTITGTAAEAGGGRLAVIEVSTDNGATWRRATGLASWSYTWTPTVSGPTVIKSRGVDDSVNVETPGAGVSVTVATGNTLQAAYGFNEGSGATVADASGKGNSGTLAGPAWTAAGKYGAALSFDGINDLVTVNDANSLDLAGAMTLEAWVKPTAPDGWDTIILKEATGDLAYALYADNNGNDTGGQRRPIVSVRQGASTWWTPGTAQLALNTWTHIAGTYDGSNLRFYVNGTLASTFSLAGNINVSAGALRIGGNNVWGEWFGGVIDEVRIYNRALAQSEIQTDMNTPIGGADTTAPTVISVTPTSGATGIAASANVTATFSESMSAETITTSTFELRDSAGALVAATVSYNSGNNTATLDPTPALAFSSTYTAKVKGGANGVKDAAGNPLAADFTWSFTTAAAPPPPTLSINDVSVTEGNSGTASAVFTVALSASSSQTVTVTYFTANGTATAGSDYTAIAATTLSFTPGQTSKTVTVQVLGDTASEGNETFFVNLTGPSNATIADGQGQGTIVDDESVLIGSEGFGYSAYTAPFEATDLVQGAAGVFTIRNVGGMHTNTVNFPAGSTFNYYATSYTSLVVSTNGLITFSGGTSSGTNTNLTSSPTQRTIAPLWDDWEDLIGTSVILGKYEDTDASGANDRLIIEWNVQGAPISPSPLMFQAILQLNTGTSPGAFAFNYADTDAGDSRTDGAGATVGIKDSGTQGANRLLVQFNSTTTYVGSGKAIRFSYAPDASPPAVSVTSPAGGATVSGTVTVTGSASDNVGVAGVQFLLDGANLGAEDTSAPYSVSWNTATASNGSHTLTARARDAAGNQTTSTVVTVTVSNQSGPAGPIAAYGFNEGSGATAADASGTGNSGAISGAAWTTAGRFGNALSFDGVNDWVTIADAASLDLTTAMTVEAWVRPSAINGWETVLMKEATGSYAYGLYADNNGNDAGQPRRPAVYVVQGGSYFGSQGTSQLALDVWTHLAATYDGAVLRLYVNGAQVGTLNQSGAINVSDGPLHIGGNSLWGEWFNGMIDEVRIYSRVLTAAEVQTDMNTPIGDPLRLLGEAAAIEHAESLSQEEIWPLLDEAAARWAIALGDVQAARRLRSVQVEILDLPGTTLGLASSKVIYLDSNGAGHGWFLDLTPDNDAEFVLPGDQGEQGRVDLLTVLAHEMGHLLGLEDDFQADPFVGNVMAAALPLSVRRIHLEGLEPTAPSLSCSLTALPLDMSVLVFPFDQRAGADLTTGAPSDVVVVNQSAVVRSGRAMTSAGAAGARRGDEVAPAVARWAGPPEPLAREDDVDLGELDLFFADWERILDEPVRPG